MKRLFTTITAMAVLLLAGCRPDDGLWWAPDRSVAALRTSEGLCLLKGEGQLSEVVLKGEIQSAHWLADSSAILVSRAYEVANWKTAEGLIPAQEAAAVKQLARTVPDLLKAALTASQGSIDNIEERFFKPLGLAITGEQLDPVLRIANALHGEEIRKVIASFPGAKDLEAELEKEMTAIVIHEISALQIRSGAASGEARSIVRSLSKLFDPVVSPKHALLAYRTEDGALKAGKLDGGVALVVSDENVQTAIWTADGRSLVHVVMMPGEKVGEIRSRTVASENGELLADEKMPETKTLGLATFDFTGAKPLLRILPDGRILFASIPVALPAKVEGISMGARFFLLDPAEGTMEQIKVNEGALPDDLSAFSVSPDGQLVAVVEAGTDVVAVLDLATGKVEIISPGRGKKSRLIPAWKNSRELTFAALPETGANRPELFLWQAGTPVKVLSKDWPDDVVKAWLAD